MSEPAAETRQFSVHARHVDSHHARRVEEASFEAAAVAYVEDFPPPLADGHEIGHHSWSNFPSWILAVFSSALFKLDFDATHDRLVGLLNITEVRGTGQRSGRGASRG